MRVEIVWEFYDTVREHEFVGSINEMTTKTMAAVQKWVEGEIPKRETETVVVDLVTLNEIGDFGLDEDGESIKRRLIGMYVPGMDIWQWQEDVAA